MIARRALRVHVALVLVSCRTPPAGFEPQIEPGRFRATISGAQFTELYGLAWIERDLGPVQLALYTKGHSRTITFAPPVGSADLDMSVGTHTVGASPGGGRLDVMVTMSPASEDFYMATSGELTITESTPERVIARFDFRAMADPGGTGKQVRVRGVFHARPTP